MIEKISNLIASKLLALKTIDEEDLECYQYGCEIAVSKFIITFVIVLCGWLSNTVLASVMFALVFTSLRQYTGGYHSKTADRCLIVSLTIYFVFLFVYKSLPKKASVVLLILAVIAVPIIFILSPLESMNKPLETADRSKFHLMSIIIASTLMLLSIMCYAVNLRSIFIVASCALSLDAAMLLLESIKERSKEND